MMRLLKTLALAAAFAGAASADIPPPEPENPLPEACQPFIGVWTRDAPRHTRAAKSWTVVSIDSNGAALLSYVNQENINIETEAMQDFGVTCAPDGAGAVKLTFSKDGWGTFDLLATPLDEGKFTTTEMSEDLGGGAPDPNFKPEAILVTWTRIAR